MIGGDLPAFPSPFLHHSQELKTECKTKPQTRELLYLAKCSECGKPIPQRVAARIRRMRDGPLLCRRCAVEQQRSDGMPSIKCRACGKLIEPNIVRRIIARSRRGARTPQLCRNCFLNRRGPVELPHQGPIDLPDEPQLRKVDEWACNECGASLEPEEVDQIRRGQVVKCEYCGSVVSRELFG